MSLKFVESDWMGMYCVCLRQICLNDEGEYVCIKCGTVQEEAVILGRSCLKIQRTEIFHAGDLGS